MKTQELVWQCGKLSWTVASSLTQTLRCFRGKKNTWSWRTKDMQKMLGGIGGGYHSGEDRNLSSDGRRLEAVVKVWVGEQAGRRTLSFVFVFFPFYSINWIIGDYCLSHQWYETESKVDWVGDIFSLDLMGDMCLVYSYFSVQLFVAFLIKEMATLKSSELFLDYL